MPPVIIADSDDEDNSYSPPHNPQARVLPQDFGAEATRSFGRNDAARENAPDALPGSTDNAAPSSSEVTAPAPFQRTVTGLIEPSSLTSISDPTATREPKASSGKAMSDWTQVSTPGRRKAPTAMMDDPVWDVPNSPDEGHARQVPKIRLKRQDAKSTSRPPEKRIIKLKCRGLASVKKTEADHDHRLDGDGSPAGARKRRKIESSHLSPQGSNEVDLVTIPFSNDNEDTHPESQLAAPSSMLPPTLPPTLPIDNDASFYISAKPLTDAQKLQYQSVHLDSSDSNRQGYLPPIYTHAAQMIESSGSATNVNTPRSDGIGFSTAPLPSAASEVDHDMATQLNDRRLPSSPDIISAIEPPAKPKEAKKRGRPKKDGLKEGPTPNDEESDYAEQPVKPKKARGRPRKKATEEVQPTTPLPANSVFGEITTTQKKKRGRPRKQDKLAAIEQSPQATTVPLDDVAQVTSDTVQIKVDSKILTEERSADHEPDEPEEEDPSKSELDTTALKETCQNTAIPTALSTVKDEKLKVPDSPVVEKGAKASPSGPAVKGLGQARGLSAITAANKPIYRVGLSKRSRIAPLLKSLRK
ncbi:hypothetical protein BKA56DRAFT_635728 [Ilyonectria sp. MPI-CAGE-AT-0026]|nr:hypothetical protein BKA56DRAFT_635728 [Ilyonectria sp. MPI-CAGE-AT-0026]